MKKIFTIFLLLFASGGSIGGQSTIYSQANGDAGTSAIWALTPVGTPQTISALIGGFSDTLDIVIQTGTDVVVGNSEKLICRNLIVQSSATLQGNSSTAQVFGNVSAAGSLGLANGSDDLSLYSDGANDTINASGSGTINLYVIEKSTISPNDTTNLTVANNVNLWYKGTSICSIAGGSTFNLTIEPGATVNLNGLGNVSTDGSSGSDTAAYYGIITINGTLTGVNVLYATSQNSTAGSVGIDIGSTGFVTAKDVRAQVGGAATLTFNVSSGGELHIDSVIRTVIPFFGIAQPFSPQGTVTLISTSVNQIAYIDNFSSPQYAGTYSGNITAERFYPAITNAFDNMQQMVGSPVGGLALGALGADGSDQFYQPDTGGINHCSELYAAPGSPYGNLFSFVESNASECIQSGWEVRAPSDPVIAGVGYSVILSNMASSGTLSLTGTPNLNTSYSISTTNSGYPNTTTDQGNVYTSGINMLSNPYPASLNANSLISDNSANYISMVYVWNDSTGSYYNPAVIAPFQAFKVIQKPGNTGTSSYVINGTSRITSPGVFQRKLNPNELSLTVTNTVTGLSDETTVGFNPSSTSEFNPTYDLIKLPGALNRHTLYSVNSNDWLWRNILKSISETSTVPVGFESGVSGSYSVSFDGINSFDPTSYITLEDKQTGTMHDIRSGVYNFTANATDNFNRFVIHFTPPAVINITDASCSNEGMINITQPGTAKWNYFITGENDTILSDGILNVNSPVNLNIDAAIYTLTLIDSNGYTVIRNIQVNGTSPVVVGFNAEDSVQVMDEVTFTTTSQNADNYFWNFGDGTYALGASATHAYVAEGVYEVALTSTNSTGCSSVASHNISVISKDQNTVENDIKIWSNSNIVFVSFGKITGETEISIYDVLGQQLVNDKVTNSPTPYRKVINNIEAGYLIVRVKSTNQITINKVFI